jgi:divalent anion:Na+ symporter, DASS family
VQSQFRVPWQRWAIVLVPGALLYFTPLPGFTPVQRHLLAVFLASIISLVAQPVPMGVSLLTALSLLGLTGTVAPNKVLSGFSNQVPWLIFSAFLFARAVTETGVGLRLAYFFIARFGRSSLTLGYSIVASDLVLAPFVPSDTARGGGIIYPITRSLAQVFHSEPGPTAERLGAFLILVGYHATYTASGMFLTSMAANPLIAKFALDLAHVELSWLRWALGAAVPGMLSLILVPWALHRLHPPEVRDTEAARAMAKDELGRMGAMSRNERWLWVILLAVMAGWVTSPQHGAPNALVAAAGVSAMLICRVLSWQDLLSEHKAWDALMWFAPLLMMATELQESGVIGIISKSMFVHIHGWPWEAGLFALVASYLYIHYAFASMTAHITALYPSFLAAALLTGAPPLLCALPLAYFSNLNAGLTHYGTGSAPVYFGAGYVSQANWWKVGFIISLLNIVFWLGVGPLWWKFLGFW